jgi:hypothetical protein
VAQVAKIPGSSAAEVEPTRIVYVGQTAKAAPASSRVGRDPMPRASASRTRPQNPTAMRIDIHSRSVTQTGMCSTCATR